MRLLAHYLIKNILKTPIISFVMAAVLSVCAALFCVVLDFEGKMLEDLAEERLAEFGNSTFYMTFNSSSSVRFFTLKGVYENPAYNREDFDYIIGGYTFTSALRTAHADCPVKVLSYRSEFEHRLSGERVVSMFSGISLIKSKTDPLWFDNDIILPQSTAQRLGLDVGDSVELLLGTASKTMTVSAIAANTGVFQKDNVLVDYEGLLSSISGLMPVAIPPNVCNIALFKLKSSGLADSYMQYMSLKNQNALYDYSRNTIEISLDYDALAAKHSAKIKSREAIVFMLIAMLLVVMFFIVGGRLDNHAKVLKTMREQGAGNFAVALLLVAEICFFGVLASAAGAAVVNIFALAKSAWPAFLCIPLCVVSYLARFFAPLLNKRLTRYVVLGVAAAATVVFAIVAFSMLYYALMLLCLAAAAVAAWLLARLMFGNERQKSSILDKKKKARLRRTVNTGAVRSFVKNSRDKTVYIFLTGGSILLTLVMLYYIYSPAVNNLFDTSDINYVMTNIASAGTDIVRDVGETEGVERALPIYWAVKENITGENGNSVAADTIVMRHTDYKYVQKTLTLSGGSNALRAGKAVISEGLSRQLGLRAGQTVTVRVNDAEHKVQIGAVIKSALVYSLVIVDATAIEPFAFNNIFIKTHAQNEAQTLTALRTRYGMQNMLIITRAQLMEGINNMTVELLPIIRLIIGISTALFLCALTASFIAKCANDSRNMQIFFNLGSSRPQAYGFWALVQAASTLPALIVGPFVPFALCHIFRIYFIHMRVPIVLRHDIMLLCALVAQAAVFGLYMLAHTLGYAKIFVRRSTKSKTRLQINDIIMEEI